jgi:Holliday junction DNA helicase RuvA
VIAYLKGSVAAHDAQQAIIEVGGIGYAVGMSARSLSHLPERGETITVFTHMYVREDELSLYGFLSQAEKDLFEHLITVSGIGPKVALAALSTLTPDQIVNAIESDDSATIARIPGVGKKTAQRLILELKSALADVVTSTASATSPSEMSGAYGEVTAALLGMGFTAAETEVALRGVSKGASESDMLRYALQRLGE